MPKSSKEDLIIRKILDHDYNGDSLVLGNIDSKLMISTEKRILTDIGQNIALINLLNKNMACVDSSDDMNIIFEYFWGFVYQYIYSNSELRQKYVDSELEEKILFFNTLLGKEFNSTFLNEKKYLFSYEPNIIIRTRGESDFKICILNYQNITSLYLIQYINLLMRERPQITILTEECGLKDNITGPSGLGFVSVGSDFQYVDIKSNGAFKLVNKIE